MGGYRGQEEEKDARKMKRDKKTGKCFLEDIRKRERERGKEKERVDYRWNKKEEDTERIGGRDEGEE